MIAWNLACLILPLIPTLTSYEIRIGLLFPTEARLTEDVGFVRSAGAAVLGIERLKSENILPNAEFKFFWRFCACNIPSSLLYAVEFLRIKKVHVIIGPPCNEAAIAVGHLSGFYNVPMILWGVANSKVFNDRRAYPTVASTVGTAAALGGALGQTCKEFGWLELGIIFTDDEISKCKRMTSELSEVISSRRFNITVTTHIRIANPNAETIRSKLREASMYARVILVCIREDKLKRLFLLAAKELNMTSEEFVYIFVECRSLGYYKQNSKIGLPIWKGEDTDLREDEMAFEAAKRSFFIDFETDSVYTEDEFGMKVMSAVRKWPFYCTDLCDNNTGLASTYGRTLMDAVLLYGYVLNKTLTLHPKDGLGNGRLFVENLRISFEGSRRQNLTVNENRTVDRVVALHGLSPDSTSEMLIFTYHLLFSFNGIEITLRRGYKYQEQVWELWSGRRPLSKPLCGFSKELCSKSLWIRFYNLFVVSLIVAIISLVTSMFSVYCFFRNREDQKVKLNSKWRIPFSQIKLRWDPERAAITAPTSNSLGDRKWSGISNLKFDSKRCKIYDFVSDVGVEYVVVGKKYNTPYNLDESDFAEFRRMIEIIDFENINRFMGIVDEGPRTLTLWKYCERGSLMDLIAIDKLVNDGFVMFSFIRELAEGLHSFHNSPLKFHGHLTSKNCLVSSDWRIKISDYGMTKMRENMKYSSNDLLWSAPEVLRSSRHLGWKAESDVYSFAIICSEILTRKTPWGLENREETVEEILYLVKSGTVPPTRPEINIDNNIEIRHTVLQMIFSCWMEDPDERPDMKLVCSVLQSLSRKKAENIMDHISKILEKHAEELESEVQIRTHLLAKEKKRCDEVLKRMLPARVVDCLKREQFFKPETFESTTLFLSDIVSFTKIAAQCTPLQVLSLLDTIYVVMDAVINEYNIYKVETIGDGYLCVSGLPERNGNSHAQKVADMAIEIIRRIKTFKIDHLPEQKLQIRIGIHTGPLIAGVVGTSMPRYCVFGDSVTIASKMESSGKGNRIHTSTATYEFLTKEFDGYLFQQRGDILLKNIGLMTTYWLLGHCGTSSEDLKENHVEQAMYQNYKERN